MSPQRDTPEQHARDQRDLRVCEMLDIGYSHQEIVDETGASKWQVSEIARLLREEVAA